MSVKCFRNNDKTHTRVGELSTIKQLTNNVQKTTNFKITHFRESPITLIQLVIPAVGLESVKDCTSMKRMLRTWPSFNLFPAYDDGRYVLKNKKIPVPGNYVMLIWLPHNVVFLVKLLCKNNTPFEHNELKTKVEWHSVHNNFSV
jgi:hypothetical protein